MASTRLSYLAVGPQTTKLWAVKPARFIRFKEWFEMYRELEKVLNDPIQNQRWKAIESVPTTEMAENSGVADLDPNEALHFLRAALGGMTSTDISSGEDGSVTRHTLTMANTIPYLTIEQCQADPADATNHGRNRIVRRGVGTMINTLSIAWSDALISLEVWLMSHAIFDGTPLLADAADGSSVAISLERVLGLTTADSVIIFDRTPQSEVDPVDAISTTARTITIWTLSNTYTVANEAMVALAPQTPSYAERHRAFSIVNARFQFGADLTAAASAEPRNVENWTFEYDNQLEARVGSNGRPGPHTIAPKGAIARLNYTRYFEDRSEYDDFINNKSEACIITLELDEVVSATDTNNHKYSIVIKLDRYIKTTDEMPTGTDELFEVQVEGEPLYDSSEGRAITIEVINKHPGSFYTTNS